MTTMSCQDFLARVSDFIDGDVDGEWRRVISEHAQSCLHCAVILDTTRRTVRLAGEPELFTIPPQVADRLHARVATALRALPDDATAALAAEAEPASNRPAPPLPPLRPVKRRFLGGWNWPLSWAVVGAILMIFGGVNWWQQTRVHTLQGWLIDAHCAARFVATGTAPTGHARWCLLQPRCQASGYGVLTEQGVFWRFNSAGSRDALAMLRSSAPEKDLRVVVRAQERDHRLYVRALHWAEPEGLISVRLRPPVRPSAAVRQAAGSPAPPASGYWPVLASAGR